MPVAGRVTPLGRRPDMRADGDEAAPVHEVAVAVDAPDHRYGRLAEGKPFFVQAVPVSKAGGVRARQAQR